jgi:hypothetical protein
MLDGRDRDLFPGIRESPLLCLACGRTGTASVGFALLTVNFRVRREESKSARGVSHGWNTDETRITQWSSKIRV